MDDNNQLLGQLIAYAHAMGATDMHISPGLAPDVVVRGRLYALEDAPQVQEENITGWAQALCGPRVRLLNSDEGAVDGVATVGPVRVRCAFRRQRGGTALTARLLPLEPPLLEDLDVPDVVTSLIDRPSGLVVVSGPTGSGKSTLLAGLVNRVNRTQYKHVMTIEDPVEYLHPQGTSRVSHREVGLDVSSFAAALRAALRARPNVVVVGEMRDTDTARAALDAASKGQLVLTTSHASSTTDALEGFVGMFPAEEQQATAGRLATVFQAAVVQQLVPDVSDTSLVPVREILLRTDGVAALIRGRQFSQLYNQLQANDEAPGMFRLEDDLLAKVVSSRISVETALGVANVRNHLQTRLESARARGAHRGGGTR